ncbi:MAG: Cell surface glycan-binding lipoprotein, utilization system for glycans and polysaccharides (PUL), SusD family [uncultured Cytophagales bacterium]|uniref:Cell surface glycan-binding lipoprotein, utilization system for glycans and polysaccharides (PUL), SusD family n=1 Tax=uncultured Cytophagales bacterium TaxID=158755 RepID=A0A6J4HSG4_9SPHI|nr:MAG: Cell surface glycan-binding lipoprotein, utilization system for glycans and polysaccharides (PUL), SusD family [uncultured Cytophagales bacterium]
MNALLKTIRIPALLAVLVLGACRQVLEPEPVNLLTNNLALSSPDDVPAVEIGLYSALRGTAAPKVIAGDLTADMAIHNGTFTEYRELSNKQITPSNGAVSALWGSLYNTVYIANFIIERLPDLAGVPSRQRSNVLATARLLRGYANFVGAYTYGDIPLVTTTSVETNRNIAPTPFEQVLGAAEADMLAALPNLPDSSANAAFVNKNTARAMLARFYLYGRNWPRAEQFATEVINSGSYDLEPDFKNIVEQDFTDESILEVGYSVSDDPGTGTYSLNNLFVGRREVIPSNPITFALNSAESGTRATTIGFDQSRVRGSDNGWSVLKYGTADEDNNNIVLFRLAEMYLIRAEARLNQNRVTGAGSAVEDLNVLRTRAKAPNVTANTAAGVALAVEQERVYELAFEGHRWYDLVRTDRVQPVMSAFSTNWNERYERWPIPLREVQNNPGLRGKQNPGY